MKRTIALSLLFVMIASMVSCSLLPEDLTLCTVNFYVDGELYDTKTGFMGKTVGMPKNPSKENQIFVGWYVHGILIYEYDFSSTLITDLDLHASFVLDAEALTNMLTTSTMKSVVTVHNKCYNTTMGGLVELNSLTSQGSGVVVDISDGYCYVLTNAHVVSSSEDYSKQSITVEDPWGNEYEAQIYVNPSLNVQAMDTSYDIALIYFKYELAEEPTLSEIELAEDPKVGDYVVSLGSPRNQKNAISYGETLAYKVMPESEDALADIKFEIILHDATIDHGSSGGPLLNASGKLIGLNFAGYSEYGYGCAIPVSRITEFMYQYVYAK